MSQMGGSHGGTQYYSTADLGLGFMNELPQLLLLERTSAENIDVECWAESKAKPVQTCNCDTDRAGSSFQSSSQYKSRAKSIALILHQCCPYYWCCFTACPRNPAPSVRVRCSSHKGSSVWDNALCRPRVAGNGKG
eukprot:6200611-Pleurochrysis_carterae.AAC.3